MGIGNIFTTHLKQSLDFLEVDLSKVVSSSPDLKGLCLKVFPYDAEIEGGH